VVRVGVGKHAKRGDGEERTDYTGIAWPGWDAPPPALHPDHPSAPLPQVSLHGSVTPLWAHIHGPARSNPEGLHPARHSYRPSHGYDPRAGSAPRPRHAAGRAGRRLYAVPDEAPGAGTQFDARTTHGAWEEAVALRRAAEQEAAAMLQHAAEEALAIRRAAEREAADLRSAAIRMSAEPGHVAAYVTDYRGKHAVPEQWPEAWPTASAPVVQEALVRPGRRARPRSGPDAKPATRQAAAAMRKMMAAIATVFASTGVSAR
jgi:hypothetical protein